MPESLVATVDEVAALCTDTPRIPPRPPRTAVSSSDKHCPPHYYQRKSYSIARRSSLFLCRDCKQSRTMSDKDLSYVPRFHLPGDDTYEVS